MRLLIKYIFSIILICFSILIILDYTYTYVQKNNIKSKFQYFRDLKNKKIDYLFLGSSRVENGLNPVLIDSVLTSESVNMGIQGARINDVFLFLRLIKEYEISVKQIFIQMDYIYNLQDVNSAFLEYQLIPFSNENHVIKDYLKPTKNYKLIYSFPFVRYALYDQKIGFRNILSQVIKKPINAKLSKGFSPFYSLNLNSSYSLPKQLSSTDKVYKNMITYIKKNKLNVRFFCAPFRDDTGNLDYIDKLKEKIPNLIDFSDSITNRNLFKDNLHLNNRGAKAFSLLFAKNLLKQ